MMDKADAQPTLTGKHLVDLGYTPGKWFAAALAEANAAGASSPQAIRAIADRHAPPPVLRLRGGVPVAALTSETGGNLDAVLRSMEEMARTPTVEAAVVMPDACPAGPLGTITVGGVARTRGAIHPGMHSADICCSMMVTDFGAVAPGELLDAVHRITHFGPGGRRGGDLRPLPPALAARIRGNRFTQGEKAVAAAHQHMGTQGDGNHFAFVGLSERTGNTVLVTHHGSRGFGALVYKAGMAAAEAARRQLSPETLPANAWLPADSAEGEAYWEALQMVREWTRLNHLAIHDALPFEAQDRLWNEHNFVFRDGDDFIHAKGATPVDRRFVPDSDGRMAIPMNMAQPVLIVTAGENPDAMGFAPHGAGRMMSRTAHIRALREEFGDARGLSPNSVDAIMAREAPGLDVRFFCGRPDVSELPSAYKDAGRVQADMERFDLARVVDRILPHGTIMAGDWEADAPWRRKRDAKTAAARA